jgi:hypothetical protein
MKQKEKIRSFVSKLTLVVALLTLTNLSCKKQDNFLPDSTVPNGKALMISGSNVVNPFSISNIRQSLRDLGRAGEALSPERTYLYYKMDPNQITGSVLAELESDSLSMILDYPFADIAFNNDSFANDFEGKIEQAKDGFLYIVFNHQSKIKPLFESGQNFFPQLLDSLYLPLIADENLQLQALITSGYYNEPDIEVLKLKWPCLLKIPSGKVTYLDQETNLSRPVPQIKVWAIAFGVPIFDETNVNGNYTVPFPFSVGSQMGTLAENFRTKVKPLNTTGSGTFASKVAALISNFTIGSVHNTGWKSSCDMKDPINIHFGNHNQPRYWAQILDAVKQHRDFCNDDDIKAAPNLLQIYAHWADQGGAASAPMLGHIDVGIVGGYTSILTLIFNENITITHPNLFNLLTGLLPDITIKQSSTEDIHYSEGMMQTMFHELAHASLFRQVGQNFWGKVRICSKKAGNTNESRKKAL